MSNIHCRNVLYEMIRASTPPKSAPSSTNGKSPARTKQSSLLNEPEMACNTDALAKLNVKSASDSARLSCFVSRNAEK